MRTVAAPLLILFAVAPACPLLTAPVKSFAGEEGRGSCDESLPGGRTTLSGTVTRGCMRLSGGLIRVKISAHNDDFTQNLFHIPSNRKWKRLNEEMDELSAEGWGLGSSKDRQKAVDQEKGGEEDREANEVDSEGSTPDAAHTGASCLHVPAQICPGL